MKRCNHPSLHETYGASEYLCGSCKTLGFGTRHRCDDCKLELHDYCTRCPETIHAPHLHLHRLTLAKATRSTSPICDICGEEADGLFFQCVDCNFDVHPLCTQLPPAVRHRAHVYGSVGHELWLRRWKPGGSRCLVCRQQCEFWWYRCDTCAVNIHPECLVKPLAGPTAAAAETATRSLRPAYPSPVHAWSSSQAKPPWPSQPAGMPSFSQASSSRENSHPTFYYDDFIWYSYRISMWCQPHWSLPPRPAGFTIHSAWGGMSQLHNQFRYALGPPPSHPHPYHQVQHHHHHPHQQTLSHCPPAHHSLHHPLHQAPSWNAHPHCQAGPTCCGFTHPPCGAHAGQQQWGTGGSTSNGASSSDSADDGPERRKKKRRIYAAVGKILMSAVTTGLLLLA